MATLTGKITDVTSNTPESISSITVKAPAARIGSGTNVIVSSPATVDFNRDTGDITITNLTGGLSWLFIEGDGWSDSIPLAVAEGMITLIEAIANAAGTPGLIDFIALLTDLQNRIDGIAQGAVDAAAESIRFDKGSLSDFGGLDTAPSGVFTVNTQAGADEVGLPRAGTVYVSRYGSADFGQALLISSGATPEVWVAGRTSTGWQPWRNITNVGYFKGALPSTGDKSQIESGVYYISNQTQRDYWGAPSSGTVYVSRYGSSNIGQMLLVTAAAPAQIWVSNLVGSQGWSEFNEIGGQVPDGGTTIIEGGSGASSGFKRVPLSVTLAQGDGNFARTSGTYRVLINFNAPVTRWRLHITDKNIHTGQRVGAGINISEIFVGERDGQTANFASAPSKIGENVALSDAPDGEWVSAWRTEPLGDGVEQMISYSYTSTSAPFAGVGAAYNTSGMIAGVQTPTQWTSSTPNRMAAFDIWIEAETYVTTPTVAVFGDSLSCAAGATHAGYDSVLNQYCREVQALPVHFAAPGNAMSDWAGDQESYKFTRWLGMDRADAVIWAMGHNDVYRGRSFAQMRADFETLYPLIVERMAKTVFAATVTTRNEPSNIDMHGVRNQWNDWLKEQIAEQADGRIRDVFDFAAVINDGDSIPAEYDSGDGVHLTTAGYTAEANSIDRPVTTPPVMYKTI